MHVLIIEGEPANGARLKKKLQRADKEIVVDDILETVHESIAWFEKKEHPDVIFMDIRLTDGLSFKIFDQIEIRSYVVFTITYDEYALKVFEVNGIDYLLKPIKQKKLESSIKKTKDFMINNVDQNLTDILKKISNHKNIFRSRFFVHYKCFYIPIATSDIAYFSSENKIVHLTTHSNQKYVIRQKFEELVQELNPEYFFKINKKYIVSLKSISKLSQSFDYKLKIELIPTVNEIILARSDSDISFKNWFYNGSLT